MGSLPRPSAEASCVPETPGIPKFTKPPRHAGHSPLAPLPCRILGVPCRTRLLPAHEPDSRPPGRRDAGDDAGKGFFLVGSGVWGHPKTCPRNRAAKTAKLANRILRK